MNWAFAVCRSTLACVLPSALAGLGLGLSLIVAIGAQNLFVLRQGIRRQHVTAVVVVCTLSDALLIVLGVSGVGALLQTLPGVIDVVRWAGALFLAGYALLAARRALRGSPTGLTGESAPSEVSRRAAVVLTWFRSAVDGEAISEYVLLIYAALVVVTLLFLPQGIGGAMSTLFRRLANRKGRS